MGARVRFVLLVGCLALLALAPARASALTQQPVGPSFAEPTFATSPPGDPRLFVVERPGFIQVLHDGTVSQFLDIHDRTTIDGERGLLSMAFDPHYASNGLFYVYYTGDGTNSGGDEGSVHVDQFHVSSNPNVADPASRRTVWTFPHSASNHNGGQLQFGPDGYLYITTGDNANSDNAQSLAPPYGKVFRIDPHGAGEGAHGIPPTNPFAGMPGATQETWALGLRNPFRFSFDHLTGDLIVGDVGEVSLEEIDFSPASGGGGRGANYGWPCREGFSAGPGGCGGSFVNPVFNYPHSDATPSSPGNDAFGCAIIGGYVYRGSQAPEILGRYLYADLCTAQLRSIHLGLPTASGDRSEGAVGALSSARSFGEDSACNVYVMNTSTVFRIVGSAASATPACAKAPPKRCACPPGKKGQKAKKKCKKRKKKHAAEAKKKHKHKKCKKKKKGKKKRHG
ncbi:MAG TPA: PQQ-dependent sugar dehydrogenase [Solirubrobacterales bacterium]|nr:PQQ-dependent sugar dehydrogenase [Solirubrobacterales bacterium]